MAEQKQTGFVQIEDMLSLEEAMSELVHVSKCMQETHDNKSFNNKKKTMQHIFNMRKASINSLLDLIQQYIDQMPD